MLESAPAKTASEDGKKEISEAEKKESGTIEYDEFEKYVIDNGLSKPTPEEFGSEMKDAFEMFDTDHNGYIDADEFKTFMMTLGDQMTEEQVSEMMKEVDTNGDGKIDYKEFCAHMMNSIEKENVGSGGDKKRPACFGHPTRHSSLAKAVLRSAPEGGKREQQAKKLGRQPEGMDQTGQTSLALALVSGRRS
ncbi:hypothetical protein EGW08_003336 [Elysia chlorotica]|uniref:EF-hand domain-containing protein n=1 Tax=Elysia chlorotica TaxID=188477 RepID=A0A433U4Z2_ELYCH|nr:hypothetical protein EGW08_003336 [Elysia chlorotica]